MWEVYKHFKREFVRKSSVQCCVLFSLLRQDLTVSLVTLIFWVSSCCKFSFIVKFCYLMMMFLSWMFCWRGFVQCSGDRCSPLAIYYLIFMLTYIFGTGCPDVGDEAFFELSAFFVFSPFGADGSRTGSPCKSWKCLQWVLGNRLILICMLAPS